MYTNHWALPFLSSFLNVFFDILKTPLFPQLVGHPQSALKAGQSGDGHVKAHGVHEAYLGTLRDNTTRIIKPCNNNAKGKKGQKINKEQQSHIDKEPKNKLLNTDL